MKKIALFENDGKPDAIKYAELTASKLVKMGAEVYARRRLLEDFDENTRASVNEIQLNEFEKYADVVVSFGGDGTMLSAVQQMLNTEVPIMGFNVGKLGFLAEFSVAELDKSLENLINGDYRVVDRTCLETEIDGNTYYALNDFVIEKRDISQMITVKTYTDEHYVGDYTGDGVVISTPTGSTAYSLSCNGPIIAPSTNVLCITPISPHSLTLRPLVVPDVTEIRIQVQSNDRHAILVADGKVKRSLEHGEDIVFRLSEAKIKLIKPGNNSYYDVLREKLLWGANAFNNQV
jgi:NAD+ kinase